MVKVLHAADFHLDSAFGALPEERSRQRRQESRQLVARMVDYANGHQVQLMLLSGDLFDGERVYTETLEEVAAALGRFCGHVLIAPGNHDFYGPRSPYTKVLWPGNVHIFTSEQLEKVEFPQYGCTVYGAAFTAQEMGEMQQTLPRGDAAVKLLVLHGDVGAAGSRYRTITTQWLAQSGVDYAALGHVHEFRGVQKAGQTSYAYAGCPEGRGFDELGEKGFLMGEVGEGTVQLQFIPFAKRRYQILQVDVSEGAADTAVKETLRHAKEDICRVVLTGACETQPDTAALEQQLADCAWQLEIRDETRRKEDIWQHRGEDSLRGLFLDELRAQYETADSEGRTMIEQAVRYGLAAMENREL